MYNLSKEIFLFKPKPANMSGIELHKDIRRVIRTGVGFRMVKDTPEKTEQNKPVSESNNDGKLELLTSFTPLLLFIKNEKLRG